MPPKVYASAAMAPSLHFVIRNVLEEQKVQAANIEDFLAKKSIERYDGAFKLLWGAYAF